MNPSLLCRVTGEAYVYLRLQAVFCPKSFFTLKSFFHRARTRDMHSSEDTFHRQRHARRGAHRVVTRSRTAKSCWLTDASGNKSALIFPLDST
jgi:hypothetical protein